MQTTHADPRCAASCVLVTSAISLMLKGLSSHPFLYLTCCYCTGEPCDDELIEKAYFMGNMELSSEKEKQEYYQYCHAKSLSDLQLSMDNSIGYKKINYN